MKESRYIKLAKTMLNVLMRARVPLYMHRKSNHIYTVWQHLILLALRQYEGKSYRRFVEWLREAYYLRIFLQLSKIPHYTTLQKFAARMNGTTLYRISGIVEAPAKPSEFYFLQQYYASMGNTNLDEIKKKFEGRFIDYDDAKLTEVVKGYVMQGTFYYVSGDPFCSKKHCRLLNAHWQEDLIESQINHGNLCQDHLKILNDLKTMI